MPRFAKNRWWTFILALSLAIGLSAASTRTAGAEDPSAPLEDQSGGLNPGDPTSSSGPGKTGPTSVWRGGMTRPVHAVGDGRTGSAWMWRLRVVAQSIRSRYFGF